MNSKLRNTIQKKIIFDAVSALTCHPSAEEIYAHVRMQHPSISKGTVYRNLNVLAKNGEIKKIELPNAPDRFDFTIKNHYHLKCDVCGKVIDSAMPYMDKLTATFCEPSGFKVESYELVFNGVCNECECKAEFVKNKEQRK